MTWFRALSLLGMVAFGGRLIGQILSIHARTERGTIEMPPYLLSPVTSGHIGYKWSDPNVFSPIIKLSER